MTTLLMKFMCTLTITIGLSGILQAQEVAPPKAIGPDVAPAKGTPETEAAPIKFDLCAGNCSRSVLPRSTHDSLSEAMTALEQAKKTYRNTAIRSHHLRETSFGFNRYRGLHTEYHIYTPGRCSWRMTSKHVDHKSAHEALKAAQAHAPNTILVLHHTNKLPQAKVASIE